MSIRTIETSIIICTRNRPDDLAQMLTSLKAQTEPPTEIILIDSSTEPVIEHPLIAALWSNTNFSSRLIYQHTQPGLTFQRNQGVKRAICELVYFFDDDVILSPYYLAEMNRVFREYPCYGGGMGTVTPLSYYKPWVNILRALFFLQRNYTHGRFTYSGMPTHAYGTTDFKIVEVLGGCCMAFRSAVFKKYSFDEALKQYGYMEDCDFSCRVSRSWPLFFNPKATLVHKQSPLDRDSIIDNKAMFIANYTYLFFKNFYPRNGWRTFGYLWSILGLFLEAIFIVRSKQWVKGYSQGLRYAWQNSAQIPYEKTPSSTIPTQSTMETSLR